MIEESANVKQFAKQVKCIGQDKLGNKYQVSNDKEVKQER